MRRVWQYLQTIVSVQFKVIDPKTTQLTCHSFTGERGTYLPGKLKGDHLSELNPLAQLQSKSHRSSEHQEKYLMMLAQIMHSSQANNKLKLTENNPIQPHQAQKNRQAVIV